MTRRPFPNPVPLWRSLTRRDGPGRLTPVEESAIARVVHRLSQGFSGQRTIAGSGYLQDPERLGAYLLFYTPVSHAQAQRVFGDAGIAPSASGRALDLGCGTGAFARALLDRGFADVWAGDHAPDALSVARGLATAGDAPPAGKLHPFFWDAERPDTLPDGPFDVITFGHVLNEVTRSAPDRVARRLALLTEVSSRLAPGGRIVIVEPATHALNAELLELRDAVVGAGFTIDAPCFTDAPCPARAARAVCHAAQPWKAPAQVDAIARRAHLDKRTLGYGWLVLRPPGVDARARDPRHVRVVSAPMRNKAGRERRVVCGVDGRFSVSVADTRGQRWAGTWDKLAPGDAVQVDGPERRESGWGLGPTSGLSRLGEPT